MELKEYALRFNCCEINKIRLVGMKFLINSKAAIEASSETFRDPLFVPWINNSGHTTGCQMIIKKQDVEEPTHSIRLLD
jgi:hypothetical protein